MQKKFWVILAGMAMGALVAAAQPLPPELKAKVEAKARQLQSWSSDAQIVAAVKQANANPPAESKAMTNEKWKGLTLLDPYVRSFNKSALGQYLKSRRDSQMSEVFVSAADGTKVAFLSKPTNWSHKGKPKHDLPLSGRVWFGAVEVDDSTGEQQVQVGLPVLDGGRPIGSIVIGLRVSVLK